MDEIAKILLATFVGFVLSLITQFVQRRFELEKIRLEWEHARNERTSQRELDQIAKIKDALSWIILRLQSTQTVSPTGIVRKLASIERQSAALVSNYSISSPISHLRHRLRAAKGRAESFSGSSYSGADDYNPLLDELFYYASDALDACDERLNPTKKKHRVSFMRRVRMRLRRHKPG